MRRGEVHAAGDDVDGYDEDEDEDEYKDEDNAYENRNDSDHNSAAIRMIIIVLCAGHAAGGGVDPGARRVAAAGADRDAHGPGLLGRGGAHVPQVHLHRRHRQHG